MRRVLVDCDPGIDDALALYAAFGSEGTAVKGITTVFGNVMVGQATRNLARILRAVPHQKVSFGEGAEQPLIGSRLPRRMIHGQDGLGDCLPMASAPRSAAGASRLIANLIQKNVLNSIVALGPLTNIARAFAVSAKAMRRLASIVVMAGFLPEASIASEFNLASDPSAGRCLLGGSLPLRWVTLNVAQSVFILKSEVEQFFKAQAAAPAVEAIAKLLFSGIRLRGDGHQAAFPDAVAMALALEPSLGRWRSCRLGLEGRLRTGRLVREPGIPNAQLCVAVDATKVRQFLWASWNRLVEQV